MADIAKLKQLFGDVSDEEAITLAAKKYNIPVTEIADEVGYKTSGKWGSAFKGAVDTAESQVFDSAEAGARRLGWNGVADFAKGRRKQNEAEAEIHGAAAAEQGLTTDWRNVRGAGDVAEFVGSTAVQSSPQMAAGLAGAATGAAIGSAVPVVGTAVGGALGFGAASLPFYFGANRAAQREQSMNLLGREVTDDATALEAAAGQTALDMAGGGPVEGAIRRAGTKIGSKLVGKAATETAEEVVEDTTKKGFRQGALRLGKDFVVGGGKEAAFSEVPQQVLEEYARRGVDPSHDLLGAAAVSRYADSAIGALALGGPVNVVTSALDRRAPNPLGDKGRDDVSGTDTTAAVPGSEHAAPPAAPTTREQPGDTVLPPQVEEAVNTAMPVPGANAAAAAQAAATPPPTPEQVQAQKIAATVKDNTDTIQSLTQQAIDLGVDPKHLKEFVGLKGALKEGIIDEEAFTNAVGALASGNAAMISDVKKALAEHDAAFATKQAEGAAAAAAPEGAAPGVKALAVFKDEKGQPLSQQAQERAFLMLGLDEEGHPVGEALTMEDVAEIESRVQGEGAAPVTKQAVQKMLGKYGLDEQALQELYDEIHGAGALDTDLTLEDQGDVAGEATYGKARITDSDQSERAGAIDTGDFGEQGSMQVVDSANKNQVVEEAARVKRIEALEALAKNPGYNDEQKASIAKALGKGETRGSAKGVERLLADKANFSAEQLKMFATLFEHGKTGVAETARRARVEAVIKQRLGVLTEHEKQVRMRQAAENLARQAKEEQERIERQAEQDEFEAANAALDADARTLRMHLMDPNKVRQARLITESLADAKVLWAKYMEKYNKPTAPVEEHLPPWAELTPEEQASFVRTVDTFNFEDKGEQHAAEKKVDAKVNELADSAVERGNRARQRQREQEALADKDIREAAQAEIDKREAAKAEQVAKDAAGRKAQRKAEAAARKAKKEKPDGDKQSAPAEVPAPAKQAEKTVGAGGRVGGKDGQEVQRSGPASAGEEVPEGGAQPAADATAAAAHGPGPVRGEDGEVAPAASPEGDGATVETRAAPEGSDIPHASQVRDFLHSAAEEEPIEGGVQLDNGKWVSLGDAVVAAQHGMSEREQAMPYQYNRVLGIVPAHWDEMVAAVKEENDAMADERMEHRVRERSAIGRPPAAKRLLNALLGRQLTPSAFARRVTLGETLREEVERHRQKSMNADPTRGVAYVSKLIDAAVKAGHIPAEGGAMMKWFMSKNPQLYRQMGLEVRAAAKDEAGVAGFYDPATRVVTLMNTKGLPIDTGTHELLHHLERLMPPEMQRMLRQSWARALAKANQQVQARGTASEKEFFKALMDYHFGGASSEVLDRAYELLDTDALDMNMSYYQYVNPSEFWAVNATNIVQGRYGLPTTAVAKIKQWLKEFAQKAASLFGNNVNGVMLRALDSLAKADGKYTSGTTLAAVPGAHFMYAGEKTANQEQLAQLQKYEWMRAGGATAKEALLATGWFRNPADGKMRYEIGDQNAEFTALRPPERMQVAQAHEEPTAYRAEESLDHPELYEAYPEARDVKITRQWAPDDPEGRVQGWFDPAKNLINISPSAENPLSVLLHEFQHWVQQKEGFAVGGSPESVVYAMSPEQRVRLLDRVLQEVTPEHNDQVFTKIFMSDLTHWPKIEKLMNAYSAFQRALHERNVLGVSGADDKALKKADKAADAAYRDYEDLRDEAVQELTKGSYEQMPYMAQDELTDFMLFQDFDRMLDRWTKMDSDSDFRHQLMIGLEGDTNPDPDALSALAAGTEALVRAYKHIAGEIEARDVQARMAMSEGQRKATMPLSSEKISVKDVVTIMEASDTPQAVMFSLTRSTGERTASFDKAAKAATAAMPPRAQRIAKYQNAAIRGGIGKLVRVLTFTEDLARQAKEALPSVVRYVQAMQAAGVARHRREEAVARMRDRFNTLTKGERQMVNTLLKDSTLSGKWAYMPEYLKPLVKKTEVTVDPAMAQQYGRLSNEAKAIVRDVFEHGFNDLRAMQRAVETSVAAEYDSAIAAAVDAGDEKAAEQARAKKEEALAEYSTLMNTNIFAPYAPLKRFGNFVVVGKSQAYKDAEAAAKTDKQKFDLKKMQADPQHYYVAFRETRAEAAMHADDIAARFPTSEFFEKDSTYDSLATGQMMAGFERMRRAAEGQGGLGDKTSAALQRMLTDLHYSLLSEASARHSERQRVGVAGADEDMMRSFLTKGRATAHFISMLENNGAAQDALSAMRDEASKSGVVGGMNRTERMDYYNEFLKRHSMTIDWKPTPNVDAALKATSYWTLLSSPASWFVNATQPFVVSMPVIAGRHGVTRSASALTKAYRELSGPLFEAVKRGKVTEADILQIVPADVREGVRELINRGRVSSDNNFDIADYNSNTDSTVLSKVNGFVSDTMGHVEILNRLTTAVTALRLEKQRGNAAGAVDYADRMIYETHGDYSGFNAPAWMRTPVGRVMGQFRKFQLIQMSMYARLLHQAFRHEDKDTRWVAKKALMYSMGSMLAWGGTMALPGAQLAGVLIGAVFGDEDEPDNQELTMRRLIGDDEMADLLLKGVPAALGIDLSGRVGAGSLGNPLPFGEASLKREDMQKNVAAALGPFVGTSLNIMDGAHKMAQGDISKGLEQMLPKGAGNAIKGLRLATQGMTQPNGDTVIRPEDISAFDGMMQGLGLPTTNLTKRTFRASAKYDMDTFFKERQTEVKRAYVQAYNSGDHDAIVEARQDFADLQAHMKADGYKPPKLSDLIKAPHEARKRERNTVGGVQFTRKNEGAVRQLAEL